MIFRQSSEPVILSRFSSTVKPPKSIMKDILSQKQAEKQFAFLRQVPQMPHGLLKG